MNRNRYLCDRTWVNYLVVLALAEVAHSLHPLGNDTSKSVASGNGRRMGGPPDRAEKITALIGKPVKN